MKRRRHTLGVFYGFDLETRKLAEKFVGNLINNEDFCKACEELEQNVKCDHCREDFARFPSSLYFYQEVGKNVPNFVEEPLKYLPENIPPVDFLLIVGIHQDLLSGIPEYAKKHNIKTVIIPIEDPKWVPPGLQKQTLGLFEEKGIQAAFPKPFCALNVDLDEFNVENFNITRNHENIREFIEYFKIGKPIVKFKLSKNGNAIEDSEVIRTAPCGSTFYVVQQLKGQYIENGKMALNEKISKAHHAYPCNASMEQDNILKDSILHVGGYLVRNAVRKALNLNEEKIEKKLKYVIK
jgi:hypothetical protein